MIAFSIGSIHIYRYGIFYLVTFLIGYFFLTRVGKKRMYAKFDHAQHILNTWVDDIVLATVIGILVGGRLGEVLLYNRAYYLQHPAEIIAVWHWGMSFIGGIVGVLAAILVVDRLFRLTRKELFIIFDLLLVVVPVGIILWRYGNFLNQELYGIIAPSRRPALLSHVYPAIDSAVRINTNMLSLLFEWVLIFVIVLSMFIKQYTTKHITPGRITLTFIFLYSIIRFVLDYLRSDSQSDFFGPFTTTQRFMIFFCLFGLAMRKFVLRKK